MRYKIYTLGCKVNEYESEVMASILENHGYVLDDNPDVDIVNTCSVTNMADSKSRKLIRSIRKKFPKALLIICGCMVQNKKEKIDVSADIIIGNKHKSEIMTYINDYRNEKIYDVGDIFNADFENMQIENFNRVRAYIKIQDGCDNYCAFCIIPYLRGHVRCKAKDLVLAEAKNLVKKWS